FRRVLFRSPSGFQHLVQPQTWLCAHCPLICTCTGLLAHRHVKVPPENVSTCIFRTPPSTDGCMEITLVTGPTPWVTLYDAGSVNRESAIISIPRPDAFSSKIQLSREAISGGLPPLWQIPTGWTVLLPRMSGVEAAVNAPSPPLAG